MKRKHFRLVNLLLSMLWIGISLLSGFQLFMVSSSAYAFSYSRVAHFIGVTPTPTLPSGPSADSSLQFNGAIIAAIIGACALITAAIIAGVFAVYQMNKNHKMELKNREQQHQADLALERQRHEAELERMRYSDKLSAEREEQERERQHRVEANTAARAAASASAKAAMGSAHTSRT